MLINIPSVLVSILGMLVRTQIIGYHDSMYEDHHDALSSALCIDDTFVINLDTWTSDESLEFYLVKCVVVRENVKDYRDEWSNVIGTTICVARIVLIAIECIHLQARSQVTYRPSTFTSSMMYQYTYATHPKRRKSYTFMLESYEGIYNRNSFSS